MTNFFSKKEERNIIAAIREAERNTSGEIRVHMGKDFDGDILTVASNVFRELGMDRTVDNSGVLFFIVPSKHQFAIWGDTGINEKVPPHFWEDVRNVMQQHFREKKFAEGVCAGVRLAGEKLKEHFPRKSDDRNELPDDLSYDK
jgi:uncharacterized membrane protein